MKRAVIQKPVRVVQELAQQDAAALAQAIEWSDLRCFLEVAEADSFKAAAKMAGCSLNTLRARVDKLEQQARTPLFRRSHTGVLLTKAGLRLRRSAQEMRAAAPKLERKPVQKIDPAPHEIRLAVTEGLGAFWLVPRIAEFQALHPNATVSLDCKMSLENMNRSDADLAIQLERPTDPSLICVRLGTLHLMPFASLDYVRRHGSPASIQEALAHRFVLQVAEQVRSDVFPVIFGEEAPLNMVALQTNTSSAHYWAVAQGVGIGVLPTYARAITKNIVPIDMELKLRRDMWLIYHPDVRRNSLTSSAIAWIRRSFDPVTYPWFSDTFLHPSDFESEFAGTNVVRLFAGFMDVPD